LGDDCANFVVYALRRQGQRVPWSDPKRLREYLDLVARSAPPGAAKITAEDLQRGTIIHFGTHVAAVMEDRTPVGILDENDLVAHQLAGAPEMVTLGELLKERRKHSFDVFHVPPAQASATLIFGGDVMLGRSCATKIANGTDPFEGITTLLRNASFAAANLECTISDRAELNAAVDDARSHADFVVCLVHWGIESSGNITDEQRELGRWLVNHGVDLVVGSHPHCVQPLDFYHGCPIAYSLGNLVFDGAPTVASWNRGALLEVGLNEGAKILSVSLVPVVLEDGLPRVEVSESNRFGSR